MKLKSIAIIVAFIFAFVLNTNAGKPKETKQLEQGEEKQYSVEFSGNGSTVNVKIEDKETCELKSLKEFVLSKSYPVTKRWVQGYNFDNEHLFHWEGEEVPPYAIMIVLHQEIEIEGRGKDGELFEKRRETYFTYVIIDPESDTVINESQGVFLYEYPAAPPPPEIPEAKNA